MSDRGQSGTKGPSSPGDPGPSLRTGAADSRESRPAASADLTSLKATLRDVVARDPMEATVVTVLGGAFLFYVAERGKNPKVTSYWDALVFISTCLSVGYADVFAKTPAGKAIASAVMTFGPALSGALLDAPKTAGTEAVEHEGMQRAQRAILGKLDEVIQELRALRPSPKADAERGGEATAR